MTRTGFLPSVPLCTGEQGCASESPWTVTSRLSAALLPAPALPPPFALKELTLPLIDASTCDGYYHENSDTPIQEPIILEDMLCAGFESGQKDACGVSKCPRGGGRQQDLPLPSTPGSPPRVEEGNVALNTRVNSNRNHVLSPPSPFKCMVSVLSEMKYLKSVQANGDHILIPIALLCGPERSFFLSQKEFQGL